MARENRIELQGIVFDRPKIIVNEADGMPKQASFYLKVIRRPFLKGEGGSQNYNTRTDYPLILTRSPELVKICHDLAKGDMVEIQGVLTTKNVQREWHCTCGAAIQWPGTISYVTPRYICPRERVNSDEAIALLQKRCEVSNVACVMGTLVKDVDFYEAENGMTVSRYQIASKRGYHVPGSADAERTDYIWATTAGKQAVDDITHLRKGSLVYLNGSLQTREHPVRKICKQCGETMEHSQLAMEIFPYAVEYLKDCVFDETESAGNEE